MFARIRKPIFLTIAILLGSGLGAASVVGVLVPHEFLAGGVSGIALIAFYLFGRPPIAVTVFLLNVPLFILGYRVVSRRFFLRSLASMATFSLMLEFAPHYQFRVHDPLLAALLAGLISGVGSGILYRAGGSGGGTEILGVILSRLYSFRVGALVFACNAVVLMAGGILLDLDKALYSMVALYVSGTVMDRIIGGFNQRKSVLIVSREHEAIAEAILRDLNRGVTRMMAEGGYTRSPRVVLYTVVALTEMARLKEIVLGKDPKAFVTIQSNMEVIGHGFQRPEDLAPPMFGSGNVRNERTSPETALW